MSSLQEVLGDASRVGVGPMRATPKPLSALGAAALHEWHLPGWTQSAGYLRRQLMMALPLLLADWLGYFIALTLAERLVGFEAAAGAPGWSMVVVGFGVLTLLVHGCLGLYPGIGLSVAAEIRQTMNACVICFAGLIAASFVLFPSPTWIWVVALIFSLVLVPISRYTTRSFVSRYSWWGQPALLFGNAVHAFTVYQAMLAKPRQGLRPIAIVDELSDFVGHSDGDEPEADDVCISKLSQVPGIIRKNNIWWGILVYESEIDAVTWQLDRISDFMPRWVLTSGWGSPLERRTDGLHDLGNIPGLRYEARMLLPGSRLMKRALDVAAILACLPVLLPIFALLYILVKRSSPGPAFYSQLRIGRWGKPYRMWKFRSMVTNAEQALEAYLAAHPEAAAEWKREHKLQNDPRITKIGRFLRKSSLDELPQLWNVFIGEMSLVGPRPIVAAEIDKFRNTFSLYQWVPPGITGLWQVSGRNDIPYEERLEYTRIYIRNWSLFFDINILFRTVKVVARCEGAY